MEPTINEENKSQKVTLTTPQAIVVAGLLIAGSIFFAFRMPSSGASTLVSGASNSIVNPLAANTQDTVNIKPVSASDHIIGNPNAPVVIVEYSDLECPFCKQFQQTMQQIITTYGSDVAWVFRNFPIASLHSKAPAEAAAAECANVVGGNGVYWKYIDEVFATTNSNNSLDPAELPKIASDVGLDMNAWNKCVSSGQTVAMVTAETGEAETAGAQGTPYSVLINTKTGSETPIVGAQPYSQVKQLIDTALAGK